MQSRQAPIKYLEKQWKNFNWNTTRTLLSSPKEMDLMKGKVEVNNL